MVVFTCGHCGESVQKPKVEKHYLTKCRNRNPNLSCMDCFKDFLGKDYESHTKCITEEERYSGKGFQAKEKKGEKKQSTWIEMVQSVLDEQKSAPRNVLRIIETISKHNNTPRKKPKFINFVRNVCGSKTTIKDIDQAWELISVKLTGLSDANQNRNQKNGPSENKDKTEDENGEENSPENGSEETQNSTQKNQNGHVAEHKNDEVQDKNGDIEQNVDNENQNGETENVTEKKLSKKQRKEEKKRQKYEAELQSAVAPVEDVTEEADTHSNNKKGKKNKNKNKAHHPESNEEIEETQGDDNNKIKKRKRQDTTNSVPEVSDIVAENIENEPVVKGKTQKKKLKVDGEDAEESICLHDQNVAKIEELSMKGDKFNWHAVIMSVLEKKGNEVPFKRLQKKVLSEYSEATGRDVDDRIADKFIKKLRSAPNVRVDKNRVILVQ